MNLDKDNVNQSQQSQLRLNHKDDQQDSDDDMIDTNIISDQSEPFSQTKKNKRSVKSNNSLNPSQNQNKYYDISEEVDSQIKQIKDLNTTNDENDIDVKEENAFDPDVY